jgi:Na+/melibiose symporter-like transporter
VNLLDNRTPGLSGPERSGGAESPGVRRAKWCRSARPSIKIGKAIKTTLSNKPFLYLCGTVLFFAGGLILVQPLLLYVNIFYVYDGDRDPASTVMGWSGTVGVFLALAMLPVGGWISEKIGKRHTAFIALSLIIIGKGSQY